MSTALSKPSNDPLHVRPQGDGGFDLCWYPLAVAADIAPGQVKGYPFLDGKVVAYRTEGGTAHVVSAFCRHLGADLTIGAVVGDELRCAFHHWYYDQQGRCARIKSGDTPPENANLFKFPTVERYGIIWVFNGREALYPPPHFNIPDDELVWQLLPFIDLPQDHWVLLSNSVDFQHLETLHGLTVHTKPGDIVQPDSYHLEAPIAFSDPKFGRIDQFTRLFGTNCLTLTGQMNGAPMGTMWAGCPIGKGQTKGFIVTVTRRIEAAVPDAAATMAAILDAGEKFFLSLTEDDNVIMQGLRFRQDMTTASDWALVQFLDYVRGYPRGHESAPYIT